MCLIMQSECGKEKEVVESVRVDTVTCLLVLPKALRSLTAMRELKVESTVLEMLPEWLGELCGLETLNLGSCNALMALPASLGALTGLTTLNLRHCEELTALPVELRALTGLTTRSIILRRAGCAACRARGAHGTGDAEPGKLQRADGSAGRFRGAHDPGEPVCFKVCGLHTPPPIVVRAGTMAVTQYLRDLAKGYVTSTSQRWCCSATCARARVALPTHLCWAVPPRVLPTTGPSRHACCRRLHRWYRRAPLVARWQQRAQRGRSWW